jgi:hypothetical protein
VHLALASKKVFSPQIHRFSKIIFNQWISGETLLVFHNLALQTFSLLNQIYGLAVHRVLFVGFLRG